MKKNSYLLAVACFVGAFVLFLLSGRPDGQFDSASRAEVALSGALFGSGLVNLIIAWGESKRTPEQRRKIELEQRDERNIAIREKAAMSAWYWTLYLMWAAFLVIQIFVGGLWGVAISVLILLHYAFYAINLHRWSKKL